MWYLRRLLFMRRYQMQCLMWRCLTVSSIGLQLASALLASALFLGNPTRSPACGPGGACEKGSESRASPSSSSPRHLTISLSRYMGTGLRFCLHSNDSQGWFCTPCSMAGIINHSDDASRAPMNRVWYGDCICSTSAVRTFELFSISMFTQVEERCLNRRSIARTMKKRREIDGRMVIPGAIREHKRWTLP